MTETDTGTKTITIAPAAGTWVVRTGDAIIGESSRALELGEDGHAVVIYFPREDIATAFLDRSATQSHCPFKGDATYYSIAAAHGTIADAAWSYETPIEGMEMIAGYLAFYPDKVTLERI